MAKGLCGGGRAKLNHGRPPWNRCLIKRDAFFWGLLCLQRNGANVTVLEARDRVGGRVHSFAGGGFTAPVDLGGWPVGRCAPCRLAAAFWGAGRIGAAAQALLDPACSQRGGLGGWVCYRGSVAKQAYLPVLSPPPRRRLHHHRHQPRCGEGAALRPLRRSGQVGRRRCLCCLADTACRSAGGPTRCATLFASIPI
jgi:hypothetical protein